MTTRSAFTTGLALWFTLLCLAPAGAADLVNSSEGLALQGYDPVSFFTEGAPVVGRTDIAEVHRGATYRFASAENQETFRADPDRYAPAFGGYCAYGVGRGKLFSVEIETAQILDGRLVLNKDLSVKRLFDKDRTGNLAKANAEWPALNEEASR